MVRKKPPAVKTPRKAPLPHIDRWWLARASALSPDDPICTNPNQTHIFATPLDMWEAACEYFEWMSSRPQYEDKVFQYMGSITHAKLEHPRPFTLKGIRLYFGMSIFVWQSYKEKRGPEFTQVCELIEDVIYQQKFEGASVSFFNSAIIARDLGLQDRQEISGPNGGPIQTHTTTSTKMDLSTMSDKELDTLVELLDSHGLKGEADD